MSSAQGLAARFEAEGFALLPDVLSAQECRLIAESLGKPAEGSAGSRNLLLHSWCAALARRLQGHELLSALVPANHVAVQCTYFEKSSERNWLVPVHQDLSIPVAERSDDPGLSGWSEKEGVLFVQPPVDLLEQLVAVRLHLDDCGAQDGPLRVVPGSHRLGRMDEGEAVAARQQAGDLPCISTTGGLLALRPLLLHASSKSSGSSRRRVLHFVYGPRLLGYGLRWPGLLEP